MLELRHKIRPAMLGRPLSRTMSLTKNLRVLSRWEALADETKSIKLLAYFGTDQVPSATESPNEHALLRRRGRFLSHPWLKRAELVGWLKATFQTAVDARLVSAHNASLRGPALSDQDFPPLVAHSMLNINVCGLRRSIPFRFVDSFMVGTGIVTDELAVRWYQPFEEGVEVTQMGRLGYELPEDTEWDRVHECLAELHAEAERHSLANRQRILERYRAHWRPDSFARYILKECEGVA